MYASKSWPEPTDVIWALLLVGVAIRRRVGRIYGPAWKCPARPADKAVLAYADLLQPDWRRFGLFNRPFTGVADVLSEQAAATMEFVRKQAKKAILSHLPRAIQEFRALAEMMEWDRKC
jgi:hypothetical protein